MLHLGAHGFRCIRQGAELEGGAASAFGVQVGEGFIFRVLRSGGKLGIEALAVGLGEILHQHIGRGHEAVQIGALAGGHGVNGDDSALSALVIVLVLLPIGLDFFFRSSGGGGQGVLGQPGGLAAHLLVHHVHQVAGALALQLQAIRHQVAHGLPHHHVGNHAAECFLLLVVGRAVAETGEPLVELLVEAAIGLLEHGHSLQIGVNLLLGGGNAQFLCLSLDDRAVHGRVHRTVIGKAIAPALVHVTQELDELVILRVLGGPGLQGGHFGIIQLLVFVFVEHVAQLAAGVVVQSLHIVLTIFTQTGGLRVGVPRAVYLNIIVLDEHAAAVTVVHHQQTKTYAGHYDEYEKRVFTDEFECAHDENVLMRLFYAFPPSLQARKPLRCVIMAGRGRRITSPARGCRQSLF